MLSLLLVMRAPRRAVELGHIPPETLCFLATYNPFTTQMKRVNEPKRTMLSKIVWRCRVDLLHRDTGVADFRENWPSRPSLSLPRWVATSDNSEA
jgi:hypothetical protein